MCVICDCFLSIYTNCASTNNYLQQIYSNLFFCKKVSIIVYHFMMLSCLFSSKKLYFSFGRKKSLLNFKFSLKNILFVHELRLVSHFWGEDKYNNNDNLTKTLLHDEGKMWRLKIAEGDGKWLTTTNDHVGRQHWEFDAESGSAEERAQVEIMRQEYKNNRFRVKQSADLLMRMQVSLSLLTDFFCSTNLYNWTYLKSGCREIGIVDFVWS